MKANAHIHFIGIGGIGMSGIAQILLQLGYQVSGSDKLENQETKKLSSLGAQIYKGHDAAHVKNAEIVVVSSAISPSNPEYAWAKEKNLIIMPRAKMLAELMRKKKSIVVSGSHGKSTTSAMVTAMLLSANLDPTAVIGGRLKQIAGNAKFGTDDWFVAESDESDGSFLHLLPFIAVVTNIDREHMDHYGSMTELRRCFAEFISHIPFDGLAILCADHEETQLLGKDFDKRIAWYGIENQKGLFAKDIETKPEGSQFTVCQTTPQGVEVLGNIVLSVSGKHNVLNALAAMSVGLELNLPWLEIKKGIESFAGIDRRMQFKGSVRDITVIDDYAHHPTEIKATMNALEEKYPQSKKWVVFQPHRYSRLKDLWSEFAASFSKSHVVCVLPVYAASETPIVGIEGDTFAKNVYEKSHCETHYFTNKETLLTFLNENLQGGDVVVTMGAGDVTYVGPRLLEVLSSP